MSQKERGRRLGRRLLWVSVIGLILIMLFPVGVSLFRPVKVVVGDRVLRAGSGLFDYPDDSGFGRQGLHHENWDDSAPGLAGSRAVWRVWYLRVGGWLYGVEWRPRLDRKRASTR
jgi:hypothetical protein